MSKASGVGRGAIEGPRVVTGREGRPIITVTKRPVVAQVAQPTPAVKPSQRQKKSTRAQAEFQGRLRARNAELDRDVGVSGFYLPPVVLPPRRR